MCDIPQKVVKEIQGIFSRDPEKNNIAFLLLTSKSEHYIRDKVALKFYNDKKFPHNRFLVAREWSKNKKSKKKIDLAILNNRHNPRFLFEFKLSATATLTKNTFKKDKNKLLSSCGTAKAYFVYITSILDKIICSPHDKLIHVSYRKGVNANVKEQKNMIDKVKTKWSALIQNQKIKGHNQYSKFFGIGTFYGKSTLTLFVGVIRVEKDIRRNKSMKR